jgi:hypothetical protein
MNWLCSWRQPGVGVAHAKVGEEKVYIIMM